MQEIKITVYISKDGEISAETKGIKGESCITELEALMADIAQIESLSRTDEYYQENRTQLNSTLKRR